MEQLVQTVSTVLLSGQLASAFGHEVYNKVSGLDLQISNVRARLLQVIQTPEPSVKGKLKGAGEAMDQVAEMATALKRTVQDFQRLTRSSETRLVDINQAVIAAKTLVNPLALRQKAQVYLELDADVPHCMGSSIRLQQVFLNLMLNAVQHMADRPEERRVLRVATASAVTDGKLRVQIRFSDSGPGIHRKLWDKVFELGYTTRADGSGLGLYIARSLVESIHGRITIEDSLIELGTTFLVELPALPAPLPGLGATQ